MLRDVAIALLVVAGQVAAATAIWAAGFYFVTFFGKH